MIFTEFIFYGALFYIICLILIIGNSVLYGFTNEKNRKAHSLSSSLWVGRPITQLFLVIMIATSLITAYQYYQIRTFDEVIESGRTGNVLTLKVSMGQKEPCWVKDPEVIHKVISTLEESTYMPSFKESTRMMKGPIIGKEITMEFVGMDMMDSITISNRGLVYNNRTGQAYGITRQDLFELIYVTLNPDINSYVF